MEGADNDIYKETVRYTRCCSTNNIFAARYIFSINIYPYEGWEANIFHIGANEVTYARVRSSEISYYDKRPRG